MNNVFLLWAVYTNSGSVESFTDACPDLTPNILKINNLFNIPAKIIAKKANVIVSLEKISTQLV